MIVLGIDTSGAAASAAIRTDRGVWSAQTDQPRAHAAALPGLIERAVAAAGVPMSDIEGVAVARGPGLFTGMRVGLVTGAVIAEALRLPVAGVSTLAAAALRVVRREHPATDFWVVLDARRREVFAQRFGAAGEPLQQPRALAVGSPEIGPVAFRARELGAQGVPGSDLDTSGLAAEVAELAHLRWRAGGAGEPATALYLRRPDTTAPNSTRSVLGPR